MFKIKIKSVCEIYKKNKNIYEYVQIQVLEITYFLKTNEHSVKFVSLLRHAVL